MPKVGDKHYIVDYEYGVVWVSTVLYVNKRYMTVQVFKHTPTFKVPVKDFCNNEKDAWKELKDVTLNKK